MQLFETIFYIFRRELFITISLFTVNDASLNFCAEYFSMGKTIANKIYGATKKLFDNPIRNDYTFAK